MDVVDSEERCSLSELSFVAPLLGDHSIMVVADARACVLKDAVGQVAGSQSAVNDLDELDVVVAGKLPSREVAGVVCDCCEVCDEHAERGASVPPSGNPLHNFARE